MKSIKLIVTLFFISIFFIPAVVSAADSSVGEFVTDSAITTQIKAKLLGEKDIDSLHIKVDTDNNGVVVLTGAVKSKAEEEIVHNIAHSVDGVKKVVNKLIVDPALFN
ncbi:MAG: BON domain-containing protein [Nitrosomonas sp.]|uniref:BON domain-containing protein n=1 Tax=Nitrosomonas sp. TaxID=42353 RepID=UPI0025E35B5A|nr:BON domain-containing protein [Nitrosomonas sp.]MBY0475425.1 BON domain-containing protein [Nitrosomonas sp.]